MASDFDPKQAKLQTSCATPGILFGICRDGKSGRVFGAGTDGFAYAVDTTAEELAAEKMWKLHDNYVSSLAYLDGVMISGSFDRRIHWSRSDDGKLIHGIDAHDGWVRDIALFPDGTQLASVGDDMRVKIWNANTGQLRQEMHGHAAQTPQGHATALYAVAVSPDGATMASGDRVGVVCVWDATDGKLIRKLQAPEFYTFDKVKRARSIGGIRSVAFSPDGSQLAIGGIGQVSNVDGFVGPARVELWDWGRGHQLDVAEVKHKAVLNHVAFHPQEPLLMGAGGGDSGGLLAFWERRGLKSAHALKPKGHLQRFLIDADGSLLWAVGHGGFQMWRLGTKESQKANTVKKDQGAP